MSNHPHRPKLRQEQTQQAAQQSETDQETQARQEQAALEFAQAEDLIRHDASKTEVPASLPRRLQESIAREPKPARPWWRRWLGEAG